MSNINNESWQMLGNIASTAGLTAFGYTGVKGVVAGYYAYLSPDGSLAESEKKLKRVQSRLKELSPERRKEIESASKKGQNQSPAECSPLQGLETRLETYVLQSLF